MTDTIAAFLSSPRLHHVGIVTPSERLASDQMTKLGLREQYRGYVERWDVTCIFCEPNGGSPIEFVIPGSGPLKEFNRGIGGLHHVALTVPNLKEAMEDFARNGVTMLEKEPVKGAGPFLCNFLLPVFTRGFAVELVQIL